MNSSQPESTGLPALIAGFMLGVVLALPLTGPWFDWSIYDQQRMGQIVVIFAATLAVVFAAVDSKRDYLVVPAVMRRVLAVIVFLGLASSAQSAFPGWALIEMSLVAGCLTLGWFVACIRPLIGRPRFDRILCGAIVFLCTALVLRFLVSYASLLSSDQRMMDTGALLDGFPNLRFFGHFQTLMTPILALPLLVHSISRGRRAAIFLLLVLWWTMVVAGGTRGTWLGLGVTLVVFAFCGKTGRAWSAVQAVAALAGFVVFYVLMTWLPGVLGLDSLSHASERLTTTLNARDMMWLRALELTRSHPWLGAGPMHYAHAAPPDFAGPHQILLLWVAEWGIPASLLALGLAGWVAASVWRSACRSMDNTLEHLLCLVLAASFCGAMVQSMVCGVFTVPYTQLWLSILGGWLLSLRVGGLPSVREGHCASSGWRAVAILSAVTLIAAAIYFGPGLEERRLRFLEKYPNADCIYPRFWNQGFIGL